MFIVSLHHLGSSSRCPDSLPLQTLDVPKNAAGACGESKCNCGDAASPASASAKRIAIATMPITLYNLVYQ
ncbi:hypothetical protein IEO21_01600 [Rhodonia placenta]|uniref:Uncharacterized protein n=1 Tax=Rhodonia placenta TaxID=104341 RepID=A0A8H7P9F0_9APHY|nr:hypothetical protein IEO21_01600 [Postia placenta]